MYKQRGTKEARRARYERLLERNTTYSGYNNGPGKAFAGSRKNKRMAKHLRHASLSDWSKPHTTVDHVVRSKALTYYTVGELNIDHANGSKPEHASRAVNIETCFPQIIVASDKDTESLLDKLNKKFGRRG